MTATPVDVMVVPGRTDTTWLPPVVMVRVEGGTVVTTVTRVVSTSVTVEIAVGSTQGAADIISIQPWFANRRYLHPRDGIKLKGMQSAMDSAETE